MGDNLNETLDGTKWVLLNISIPTYQFIFQRLIWFNPSKIFDLVSTCGKLPWSLIKILKPR